MGKTGDDIARVHLITGHRPYNSMRPRGDCAMSDSERTKADQNAAGSGQTASVFPKDLSDIEKLSEVSSEIIAESVKVGAVYLDALENGDVVSLAPDESADFAKTIGAVAEYWLKDPARIIQAQKSISLDMINLWSNLLQKVNGEDALPVVDMPARDNRFADPEWTDHPYFNFLKQAYFIGSQFANELVEKAEDLDPHTKQKAGFYVRQLAGALSPSNFIMTNPELLRTTVEQKGENIVRGMRMLAEDVAAGKGEVKIRQTDGSAFEVGVNLANTPGKVIFRNDLMELIQYSPTTETVFKQPLLIVPPWINKFYILDLNPEKSFIRWAVSQGLTVFVIAWVNPDARHRTCDWTAYMNQGPLAALDEIEAITGEKAVSAIGYCVGGTLLAATLAWLAQTRRPKRIAAATFFTTQVDFTYAGELLTFADEEQVSSVEQLMARVGFLPGAKMASAFNMLRPNDLIWSYMVNNYLKGKTPPAFDLLFWNSDATNMAEANHSFYLRNCYMKNALAKGEMSLGGKTLDLRKITIPIYNLAAKEDHIAPAKSVFEGSKMFGGPVTYVMSGSGHIAGVINPVSKPKYQFWTGGTVAGQFEDWLQSTTETAGSWWPHWLEWVSRGDTRVPARTPGGGVRAPLCDAPGTYVKAKA
ncbi:PhaC Poly(3-hydroxyalkanoate) synthetase [Rhabdaerophilaceae bacterium]